MHGFRRRVALLLVLTGLTLAVAGCSGSGGSGSGDSSPGGGSATYTNDQYGFTLTHDTQFTEGEPVDSASAGGSSVFDIVFADKGGTIVADKYVDAIQVSVYQLAREVTTAEVPKLKSEVQGVVDQLMSSSSAEIVEPLSPVTVNGIPGFKLTYTYSEGGTALTAVTYFLFKGKNEYQITAQATTEKWDALQGKLEGAITSFTAK